MNQSPMLWFYLGVLFVFLSGSNISAEQVDSSGPSGLVVEITSPDLSPFTLPVLQDGTFETTWSCDVPRTPLRPADHNQTARQDPPTSCLTGSRKQFEKPGGGWLRERRISRSVSALAAKYRHEKYHRLRDRHAHGWNKPGVGCVG